MLSWFQRNRGRTEPYLAAVILVMCVVWTLLTPHFLTLQNMVDLVETYSVNAIFAMGLFVVLVAGGIDISFAAIASVAQYSTALLATKYGLPPHVSIPIGLSIGIALGCVNATLIHFFRITSIIITVATMNVYFALLMYFTSGKSIYNLPDWWSTRLVLWQTETEQGLVRITLPIIVMVICVILTWGLMNRVTAGRQLYSMGGNPEAARRLGVSIGKMHYLAYGYLGLMAGVAGLVQAHRVGESVPNALVGQELNVLAAAVLGGASLIGGIGTVPGVLLGILLLAVLQNGLNLLGVSPYFFQIAIGLVILVATSITGLSSRPGRRISKQSAVAAAAQRT